MVLLMFLVQLCWSYCTPQDDVRDFVDDNTSIKEVINNFAAAGRTECLLWCVRFNEHYNIYDRLGPLTTTRLTLLFPSLRSLTAPQTTSQVRIFYRAWLVSWCLEKYQIFYKYFWSWNEYLSILLSLRNGYLSITLSLRKLGNSNSELILC